MLRTMKTRVARGRYGKDEGFTLIELMVVVLIIAILLAIAIPTFLGAQNKAKDRSAQSSLRNSLTLAKSANSDLQDYSNAAFFGTLDASEPTIDFVVGGTASLDPKTVSVYFVMSFTSGASGGPGLSNRFKMIKCTFINL